MTQLGTARTEASTLGRGVHRVSHDGVATYFATTSDGRRLTWLSLPEGMNEPQAVAYLARELDREDPIDRALALVLDDAPTDEPTDRSSGDASLASYETPQLSVWRLPRRSAGTLRSLRASTS